MKLKNRIMAEITRPVISQARYMGRMKQPGHAWYLVEIIKLQRAAVRLAFLEGAYQDFLTYLADAEAGIEPDGFANLLNEENEE